MDGAALGELYMYEALSFTPLFCEVGVKLK